MLLVKTKKLSPQTKQGANIRGRGHYIHFVHIQYVLSYMCSVYCHTNIKSAVALFCFIVLFVFVNTSPCAFFCTYLFFKTKPCPFFLFFFTTAPKTPFNEMSKLHLVLVLATAHFLPVGISTPNLTRAAAVLTLFILFYVFPLIFLAFYKMITIWQETQTRYEGQGKHD